MHLISQFSTEAATVLWMEFVRLLNRIQKSATKPMALHRRRRIGTDEADELRDPEENWGQPFMEFPALQGVTHYLLSAGQNDWERTALLPH
jgi:hypothetical protein